MYDIVPYLGRYEEVFSVLGATGNVYTVRIGRRPTCDCPDCTKARSLPASTLPLHILAPFLQPLLVHVCTF